MAKRVGRRTYRPQAAAAKLLDAAWSYVESVSYAVSARWLFYRLLQDSWVSGKGDYARIIALLSAARKGFYKGWRPDTLADDTREVAPRGAGYCSAAEWIDAIERQVYSYSDRWAQQPAYVIVCFEAAAMAGQFDFYLPPFVPRVAFKGDVSIPAKWKLAKLVDNAARRYSPKDVVIIYFGDLDPKGLTIPESAMDDISDWAQYQPGYVRAGLNPGDEVIYSIPENPERPGTYQWEGLDDSAAGELITDALAPYIRPEVEAELAAQDQRRKKAFANWWTRHKPSVVDLELDESA